MYAAVLVKIAFKMLARVQKKKKRNNLKSLHLTHQHAMGEDFLRLIALSIKLKTFMQSCTKYNFLNSLQSLAALTFFLNVLE